MTVSWGNFVPNTPGFQEKTVGGTGQQARSSAACARLQRGPWEGRDSRGR